MDWFKISDIRSLIVSQILSFIRARYLKILDSIENITNITI